MYYFITSASFVWLMNGMRQFIPASILFGLSRLIVEKKWKVFFPITLLLSTIHGSAIILIPSYFIVQTKPWSKATASIIAIFVLCTFFFQKVIPGIFVFLQGTQYAGYEQPIISLYGSNILRFIIASIPPVLAFMRRREIEKLNDPILSVCINMSILNACIFMLSSAGGSIFIGRLNIYFELYNLLLLPVLFSKVYKIYEKVPLYIGCIIGYLAYFYYQMVIVWHAYYYSDILNLYFWR
jgi:transmembrane protein EpsG